MVGRLVTDIGDSAGTHAVVADAAARKNKTIARTFLIIDDLN
jgi:hypothetical protein